MKSVWDFTDAKCPDCVQSFLKSLKCLCFKCRPDLRPKSIEEEMIEAVSKDMMREIDRNFIEQLINP